MKEIPLSKGKVALVDDEDYEWLMQYKWHADDMKDGRWYAANQTSKVKIYMHRLILSAPKDMEVDHKDRDGLNNTRKNLRICTGVQNRHNTGVTKRSTTGYKGVHFYKARNNYTAQIMVNRKMIHLGYFKTPIEAARAYDSAAVKYYGEYAFLNFSMLPEQDS